MKKRVLITGGTGFAGTYLAQYLATTDEYEVHCTSFGTPLTPEEASSTIQRHQIDLTNHQEVSALLAQIAPHYVYHLAALTSVAQSFENTERVLTANMTMQIAIMEAIKKMRTPIRLLVVSSGEIYGLSEPSEIPISEEHPFRPVSPYAVSKITQDMLAYSYAKAFDLAILRVRPFNHTGPQQLPIFAVPSFAQQIAKLERLGGGVLSVGNLEAIRDISDVRDVVRAYVQVMEQGQVGEVYNVGSGVGVKMQTVVTQLIEMTQQPITIEVDKKKIRPLDIPEMIANNSKLRSLGWEPQFSLKQTLFDVLEWYRSQENV